MAATDNPAGRLLRVVETLAGSSPNHATKDVLAASLGVASTDTTRFYSKVAGLEVLVGTVEALVRHLAPEHVDLHLGWLQPVRAILALRNLDGAWSQCSGYLSADAILSLRYCDRTVVGPASSERTISEEGRDDIYQELQEFRNEVIASDLREPLRSYVLEQLDAILAALQDYALFGVRPLERVVEQAVGAVVLHPEIRGTAAKDPWSERLWTYLARIGVLLNVVHEGWQLGSSVLPLAAGTAAHVVAPGAVPPPGGGLS